MTVSKRSQRPCEKIDIVSKSVFNFFFFVPFFGFRNFLQLIEFLAQLFGTVSCVLLYRKFLPFEEQFCGKKVSLDE